MYYGDRSERLPVAVWRQSMVHVWCASVRLAHHRLWRIRLLVKHTRVPTSERVNTRERSEPAVCWHGTFMKVIFFSLHVHTVRLVKAQPISTMSHHNIEVTVITDRSCRDPSSSGKINVEKRKLHKRVISAHCKFASFTCVHTLNIRI